MARKFYLILLLVAGMLSAGCRKDQVPELAYNRSLVALETFKASSGDSYRYKVTTVSFSQYETETTITVRRGKVVSRSFLARGYENDTSNQIVVKEEWTEDGGQLGTHTEGFDPMTLDELYVKARKMWMPARKDVQLFFETRHNGMISLCGYVPDGCADDCFTGVRIALIERL